MQNYLFIAFTVVIFSSGCISQQPGSDIIINGSTENIVNPTTVKNDPDPSDVPTEPTKSTTKVPPTPPPSPTPDSNITTVTPPTSTATPNITTVTPNTTTTPNVTSSTLPPVTTTSPAPHKDRHFDGPSFIGGIVLASGLVAIGFVAFKFYKARTERNYHTL